MDGVFNSDKANFLSLVLIMLIYTLLWFTIYFIINYFGNGSSSGFELFPNSLSPSPLSCQEIIFLGIGSLNSIIKKV